MKKTFYIFAGLILALILVIVFTVFNQNPETKTETTNVKYTDLTITFNPTSNKVVVTGNFLSNPTVRPDEQNPGLYQLGNDINIDPAKEKLPNYVAIFDKETGVFTISLVQQPFAKSRTEAETYLKNLLQISDDDMCKLSYSVTVPGYVDQDASGLDYRFSFCPGATVL